ncbi:MAG TPA: HAD-IC family P-type ATPase [Kineosporiaceae bacterium]
MFTALLEALVEPARQLGVPSLPRHLLNVLAADQVHGRRAWARDGRAAIEVRLPGAQVTGAAPRTGRLIDAFRAALDDLPGVAWVGVNLPLGRVVVAIDEEITSLPYLVEVFDKVEHEVLVEDEVPAAPPPRAEGSHPPVRGARGGVEPGGVEPGGGRVHDQDRLRSLDIGDRRASDQALAALAADSAGLLLAGVGRLAALAALPVEAAALVTVVETVPRLRGAVESLLGRSAADPAIAVVNAAAQGLAHGAVGLAVDGAYRLMALAEARAGLAGWRRWNDRHGLDAGEVDEAGRTAFDQAHRPAPRPADDEGRSAAVAVPRPCPLAPGPVERWGDQAGALGAAAFGVGVAASGDARRSAAFALGSLPKAARLGREGFATQLGRILARRDVLVPDRGALRRLDRIGTVVLDADVLVTGGHLLGEVRVLPDADRQEVAVRLHALFRGEQAFTPRRDGPWRLAKVEDLPLSGRKGVRERAQLDRSEPVGVLGLARGGRLMAVAAVVPEPVDSLDTLAAAAHRSGVRLVIAGDRSPIGSRMADAVLPGGPDLPGTVRTLQSDGRGVLLLSRDRVALRAADVGVGVGGGPTPGGAHVLVGADLATAALLIDACGVAARTSRRSVALAQTSSGLAGVAAAVSAVPLGAPRSLLAVNLAAAVALAQGAWSAIELAGRPVTPPVSRIPWHAIPADGVLERLGSRADGLDRGEVRRRQRHRRDPALTPTSRGLAAAVVEELSNPLTPILAGGAALSAVVGSIVDAALVAGVTLASALLGGVQRRGTDEALTALLQQSAVSAQVRRDSGEVRVPADQLVPGDVVLVRAGDVVPADCRVLEAVSLEVDESSLTGEAFPVAKGPAPVIAAALAERTSMLYEGTTVAAGRGRLVVVATGSSTEAGRSMAASRTGTPVAGVEARLAQITRTTIPVTLSSALAVIAAGLARGRSVMSTAGAGVSLAVAAVPEGLPFLVSAAQLAAARRLSGLGALVRNPRTIEALGRVDVLCFDKTGTLTEGRITLEAVSEPAGAPLALPELDDVTRAVLVTGLRATPQAGRGQQLAHQTDRAVTDGARRAGADRADGDVDWRLLTALAFEPSRGYHATVGALRAGTAPRSAARTGAALLSVKGAPEVVLPRCVAVRRWGRDVPLREVGRQRASDQVERLAGRGYRVLAVAQRPCPEQTDLHDGDVHGLTLLGYLALADPVRPAAGTSVDALRRAGIQIVMITGDHPGTAAAIAHRLDLIDGQRVITGPDLDDLDDQQLDALLPSVSVVARGTPAHKVRVVQAFRRLRRTVAMTGDGANDAPAIRLADVGIALGQRGTPAASAAADLVVTDDRLETIIAALVEGRSLWGSVRKALGILVGGNLGEIAFTVLGAVLTGASPLAARQLLLVNLLTDLAPSLAVALRPPQARSTDALLAEGPEASLGTVLTQDVASRAALTTLGATGGWLGATALGLTATGPTIALAALVGTQLGQTLAAAGASRGVMVSSAGSAAALAGVIQIPVLSRFFGCSPLGPPGWALAVAASTAATLLAPVASAAVPAMMTATGGSEVARPSPARRAAA